MTLLAVGLSHNTSTVPLLEQISIPATDVPKVLHELIRADHVAEAMVVSTCNRVEVYADVEKFHGGLFDVTAVLARHAGMEISALGEHLYVHYEQAAVHHLFRVAAGLDSMIVGESQILGQVRAAYAVASAEQTIGRSLHELAQRALSAGKRVHAETGIDRAGASVVGAALDHAADRTGALAGRSALVIGAGSMGALTGATLRRAGIADLVIANRTPANAGRLAASLSGRAAGLDELPEELSAADVVVSSTGSTSLVVTADLLETAMARRNDRPLVV
ncbi:MAG TPA: glutamyl-tRNA reductase, partial [Mycobacteriales bacterium]|nr:glutamyl-tRNA reductase [Mycobacteriales bacterium]